MTIEIKVLNNSEIIHNKEILSTFYVDKYYKGYEKAILNSTYIIIALDDDKVVGALRIITDSFRFALFVDFVVEENARNHGVGTKLTQKAVEVCKDLYIDNIILYTDPTKGKEWLVDFYKKLGFIEHQGTLMQYEIRKK